MHTCYMYTCISILYVYVYICFRMSQSSSSLLGDVEAARPQAVAVQRGAELDAVREAHQRGAVPGLHDLLQVARSLYIEVIYNT